MTEKRFTLEMQYWKGNPQGRKLFDNLTGQDGMSVEELCNIASDLHSKCEELESVLEVYEDSLNDDEEFQEAYKINCIYKEEGFNGVIEYAKDKLQEYGAVNEIEKGLWVMVTGGWSDNEFWLDCLNSPISRFSMVHYCAYERGGAFYYTEEPHGEIEIRLKNSGGCGMTEKGFKIEEEYLAPPPALANLAGFLKIYKTVLRGCDEEELEEIFNMVRFDWKILNKGDVDD